MDLTGKHDDADRCLETLGLIDQPVRIGTVWRTETEITPASRPMAAGALGSTRLMSWMGRFETGRFGALGTQKRTVALRLGFRFLLPLP